MSERQTKFEEERIRSPRKGRDRTSVPPQKDLRKAARAHAASNELHGRIIAVLQVLEERGDIKSFEETGQRPADPQLTVVFTVTRPGKIEPVERNFFATLNPRLCGLVPAKTRCAPILVTHEMRPERIAERILELFQN